MTTSETTEALKYELMIILKADRRDEEIQKHLDEIKTHIEDLGGKFVHEDIWGKKDFAYRIKREEMGFYAVFNFEIDPSKIKEINDTLRIDQSILRYLLFKTPKGYEATAITEADLDFSKPRKEDKKEEEKKEAAPKKEEVVKEVKEEVVEEEPEVVEEEETEEVVEEEAVEEKEEEKVEEEKPAEEVEEEEVVEEEPAEEKEEEKVEEKEPEEKEEKEEKKTAETSTMDDLDEKLKAIMNDTDIDISL